LTEKRREKKKGVGHGEGAKKKTELKQIFKAGKRGGPL